jgi:tRNA G18 (ribose-2'-O)-methylase SpoU
MLTRCPYPECAKTFEVDYQLPEGDWHWKLGECPDCKQPASLRPLEVLTGIDRLYDKRLSSTGLRGGHHNQVPPLAISVILEDIRSLWNVGSMFRTSDAAGVAKLHLCGVTGCPPQKEIAKTGLGAERTVAWEYHKNAITVMRELHHRGVKLIGLERCDTSVPLFQAIAQNKVITAGPVCLIVGNEVMGLSAEALALCHQVCHLPMRGTKESLNVAVAFGIAIYAIAEAHAERLV